MPKWYLQLHQYHIAEGGAKKWCSHPLVAATTFWRITCRLDHRRDRDWWKRGESEWGQRRLWSRTSNRQLAADGQHSLRRILRRSVRRCRPISARRQRRHDNRWRRRCRRRCDWVLDGYWLWIGWRGGVGASGSLALFSELRNHVASGDGRMFTLRAWLQWQSADGNYLLPNWTLATCYYSSPKCHRFTVSYFCY